MNYELAKQLKDAGFHGSQDWYNGRSDGYSSDCMIVRCAGGVMNVPTLEELLDACGDKFGSLYYWSECRAENERWEACSTPKWVIGAKANPDHDFVVYAQTPTEAVANLWLALNKTSPK